MMSLRQVLAAHTPVLLLDAVSSLLQAGWLASDSTGSWQSSEAEAGIGVFGCVQALGIDVDDARAFVFCEGPGSILGTRTVAMAIRTWCVLHPRPVFAYSSLALVANSIGRPEVSAIVDARRDSWHCYQIGPGLRRVITADLPSHSNLVMPEHFRHWSPLPAGVSRVPYHLPDLLSRTADVALYRPTDSPDAFLPEEPNYVTWTPQVHRAPTNR